MQRFASARPQRASDCATLSAERGPRHEPTYADVRISRHTTSAPSWMMRAVSAPHRTSPHSAQTQSATRSSTCGPTIPKGAGCLFIFVVREPSEAGDVIFAVAVIQRLAVNDVVQDATRGLHLAEVDGPSARHDRLPALASASEASALLADADRARTLYRLLKSYRSLISGSGRAPDTRISGLSPRPARRHPRRRSKPSTALCRGAHRDERAGAQIWSYAASATTANSCSPTATPHQRTSSSRAPNAAPPPSRSGTGAPSHPSRLDHEQSARRVEQPAGSRLRRARPSSARGPAQRL